MEVKIGDLYIRHSNRKIYRVKQIVHKRIVLELENRQGPEVLTDIWGLEKAYTKKVPCD